MLQLEYKYYNDFETKPESYKDLNWSGSNGFCFDENGDVAIVWEEEKGYWNLPGGGRELEENPEQTFVREVLEECQADVDMDTLKYFHCVYAKAFDQNGQEIEVPENRIVFRYICRLKNIQEFIKNKNGMEIDERRFVSVADLPNYITWLKDTNNGRESFEILKEKLRSKNID